MSAKPRAWTRPAIASTWYVYVCVCVCVHVYVLEYVYGYGYVHMHKAGDRVHLLGLESLGEAGADGEGELPVHLAVEQQSIHRDVELHLGLARRLLQQDVRGQVGQ